MLTWFVCTTNNRPLVALTASLFHETESWRLSLRKYGCAVGISGQKSPCHKVGARRSSPLSRGQRVGRVSSEWFSRPDDERYLSLTDLYDAVRGRAECAQARTVESRAVKVEAACDNAERLVLWVPGRDEPAAPTHLSFGQLCGLVGAPSSYMRQLPAPLAGINLQHGLLSHRAELVKTLETDDGRVELRAVTGPDYGRIWDHELVAAVIDIAGNGTGDTMWEGAGRAGLGDHDAYPFVDITEDTTTLYASDRDVFLFLVDDTIPSRRDAWRTDRQTCTFGASIVGTRKLDRRPSASLRFISGRCA
jgi:hypothetical protein